MILRIHSWELKNGVCILKIWLRFWFTFCRFSESKSRLPNHRPLEQEIRLLTKRNAITAGMCCPTAGRDEFMVFSAGNESGALNCPFLPFAECLFQGNSQEREFYSLFSENEVPHRSMGSLIRSVFDSFCRTARDLLWKTSSHFFISHPKDMSQLWAFRRSG